jgi:hypothetical protein
MKTAPAIAEKDAYERRLRIDYREIGIAIMIEVGYRDVVRLGTGIEGGPSCLVKSPAAIVEQNRDGAVLEIGDDDVGTRIMVEVGSCDDRSVRTGGQGRFLERRITTGGRRQQSDEY